MSERRFNQAEVSAIFKIASETQHTTQPRLPSSEGMTLAELQEIGREVGIAPDLVDQASKSLAFEVRHTSREFIGLTTGVGLSMDLSRPLSDAEWERVVADLRETFDARGKLKSEGQIRQWTNGNLEAHLEPTSSGHRIRMRTAKGGARELIIGGLAMVGFAGSMFLAAIGKGPITDPGMLTSLATLATGGLAMFGVSAFPLRGWARLRREQMERVAARAAAIANSQTAPTSLL